jgi:hypothetical protein
MDLWNLENMSEEQIKARVVLIYKKGNTNRFEHYRPIFLLNTLYKTCAATVPKRNQKNYINIYNRQTQFGFRKDRSS